MVLEPRLARFQNWYPPWFSLFSDDGTDNGPNRGFGEMATGCGPGQQIADKKMPQTSSTKPQASRGRSETVQMERTGSH